MSIDENPVSVEIEKNAVKIKEPSLFRVILHNDDYTTMEFVIKILENIFYKTPSEATKIMLNIHQNGIGLCGVYPYSIAETKAEIVKNESEMNDFPLMCTIEEAS